jgi:hypothetical protein
MEIKVQLRVDRSLIVKRILCRMNPDTASFFKIFFHIIISSDKDTEAYQQ